MIVGIDASTVRSEGGIEHIVQLLNNYRKNKKIRKIYIWSNKKNLKKIKKNKDIIKINNIFLNSNILGILFWKIFFFNCELKKKNCNLVLYCSGYFFFKNDCRKVILFQNILPFSQKNIKNILLFVLCKISYYSSDGVIFISKKTKKIITKQIKYIRINKVVYHGVDKSYFYNPVRKKLFKKNIIKLIYVSSLNFYKNQVNLIKALHLLLKKGYKVRLTLIGPASEKFKFYLFNTINNLSLKKHVKYLSVQPKKKIIHALKSADISVYPSEFETFGISLLESMACGKVIACSNLSVMPEILQNGGLYFNPKNCVSIARSIEKIILSSKKSNLNLATKSYNLAKNFSWEKTSRETFQFLYEVHEKKNFNN